MMLASEDFRTAAGEPLPYDKQFLIESVTTRPGRSVHAAGHPRGRTPPGTLAGRRRLSDVQRRSRRQPRRRSRQADLGAQAGAARPGRPIFVRGNFKTTPETILEQIPVQSGGYLTTTAVERGQRNLGFLQLFNNATPISFPGKDEKREVVPMVVEVEERYEQYSVLHAGVGVSTEQKPPDSALPFGVYVRGGLRDRNFWGHGWNAAANLTYGNVAAARSTCSFLDRRFFGNAVPLSTSPSTTCSRRRRASATSGRARVDRLSHARCIRASTRASTTTCATPPTPKG
jgi:outer membrane protein assembly factor BamA